MKKVIFMLLAFLALSSCKKEEYIEIKLEPSEVWLMVKGRPYDEVKISFVSTVEECDCLSEYDFKFSTLEELSGEKDGGYTQIHKSCGAADWIYIEYKGDVFKRAGFPSGKKVWMEISFTSQGDIDFNFHFEELEEHNIDL